ncbi:MAG: crossover junction endodeoxyribonuclease RuvC [Chloroflexi bacterium]|nr:crossover junction endodeoxyribonuclease RuvC [Chloroflexota bacterium]MDA8189374.1 crossover junction endodeoxyribonuclease RuvC [Dehalococcoidales bacterium]
MRDGDAGAERPSRASAQRLALGIDPGTAIMGYGLVALDGDQLNLLDYGVITTPSHLPLANRLQLLYSGIGEIIERAKPTELAVEELFFNRNVRTALAVGQARGVAILAAANRGLPVSEYTPLQVKQAVVGYGRARKEQIQQMVRVLLNLQDVPEPDDAADALALAICHLHSSRAAHLIDERTT